MRKSERLVGLSLTYMYHDARSKEWEKKLYQRLHLERSIRKFKPTFRCRNISHRYANTAEAEGVDK